MQKLDIKESDIGRYVILKNKVKAKITVFDNSNMPVFVKHDPDSGSLVTGTWHFRDGTYSNKNMRDYDILEFIDNKDVYVSTKDNCNHQWEYYLGLSQQFYYCKICDKKKDNI